MVIVVILSRFGRLLGLRPLRIEPLAGLNWANERLTPDGNPTAHITLVVFTALRSAVFPPF